MTRFYYFTLLCLFPLLTPLSAQDTISITDASLQADQDYTWTADNVYRLEGEVFLESGGELTIEPGTLVLGADEGSRLVITVGARILADGTPTAPIVFTSAVEAGYWGGLVLLGEAILTQFVNETAYTHSGEVDGTEDDRLRFGGGVNLDDSGTLRYVSIRRASTYGLVLAGVGSGTTIDFVETVDGLNGGMNLQGGRAFVKHYVAAGNYGTDVNVDLSYQSDNQFWYILKNRERPNEPARPAITVASRGYEELSPLASEFQLFNGTFINGLTTTPGEGVRVALQYTDVSNGISQRNLFVNFPHAAGMLDINDNPNSLGVIIAGNSVYNTEGEVPDVGNTAQEYTPAEFIAGNTRSSPIFASFNNRISGNTLIRNSCTTSPGCTNPLPLAGRIELTGAQGVGTDQVEPNTYIGAFEGADWTFPWSYVDHDDTGYQLVTGRVSYGNANACTTGTTEGRASGQIMEVLTPLGIQYTATDENGDYRTYVPAGATTLSVVTDPALFTNCNNGVTLQVEEDSSYVRDLTVAAVKSCASPSVDISAAFLRRCFESTYTVSYRNEGSQTLFDPVVTVVLDPFLSYVSGDLTPTAISGDTLFFDVTELPPFGTDNFRFRVMVSCEAELGQEHCTSASIGVSNRCVIPPGPRLTVEGSCDGTSVHFDVKNVGDATPASPVPFVIIEDEVMRDQGSLQLAPGLTESFTFEATGTFHFSTRAWPDSTTQQRAAKTLNCPGTTDFPTFLFPATDTDAGLSLDCQPNIGAYDPNDKRGYPFGLTEAHSVPRNLDMRYHIRFQNTGTDTAFTVVVTDTLSELLDLATLKMGAASHPMTWSLEADRVLRVSFDNIMLPDSNINEPASNGFFQFEISAADNLDFGDLIENEADIFFDFNDPIRTNLAFHTVTELFEEETTANHLFATDLPGLKAYPQPARDRVTFEVEGGTVRDGFYALYGTDGRLRQQNSYTDGRFTAPVSDLAPGLYVCMLKTAKGQTVALQKFLVQ